RLRYGGKRSRRTQTRPFRTIRETVEPDKLSSRQQRMTAEELRRCPQIAQIFADWSKLRLGQPARVRYAQSCEFVPFVVGAFQTAEIAENAERFSSQWTPHPRRFFVTVLQTWKCYHDIVTDRLQDHVMKTAFKEWAAICRGLGQGRQIVILRKGGI